MKKDLEEPQLPFQSAKFKETWDEWIEYRKDRRLPKYVPRGLKMTFKKLLRESDNNEELAIRMIENSMEQNYQGIFQLKPVVNGSVTNKAAGKLNRHEAGIAGALNDLKEHLNQRGIPDM